MSTTLPDRLPHFSRCLAELRRARGLSLYALAKRSTALGYPVTDQALAKLEDGRSRPYLHTALGVATALGVPLADMLPPEPEKILEEIQEK